jgi:polysaccharide pyruvyl transferase WcaK-like protein
VHDPGVLTSIHFPRAAAAGHATPHVGLGVTHPIAVRYHADDATAPGREYESWFIALAHACLARGWKLTAFTNGSPEDEAYLARLGPKLAAAGGAHLVSVLPRRRNPREMAQFVSTLDLLMAHRLHANIAAYSYAIPQIGFAWDTKLKSFLAQVARSDCICAVGVDSVESVVELAARELDRGVEPKMHRETLARARADVAQLGAALYGAVHGAAAVGHGAHASAKG